MFLDNFAYPARFLCKKNYAERIINIKVCERGFQVYGAVLFYYGTDAGDADKRTRSLCGIRRLSGIERTQRLAKCALKQSLVLNNLRFFSSSDRFSLPLPLKRCGNACPASGNRLYTLPIIIMYANKEIQ